jgi:uncharacterized protein YkwD
MARLGRLEHASAGGGLLADRLDEAGIPSALSAENVARSTSSDPALIHKALMSSEGHRENILLAGVDEIGVGVVRSPGGDYYVTQNFIRSVIWRDTEAVRAALLGALAEARRRRGLPPLLVFEEITRTADDLARLKAQGHPASSVPPEFGVARIEFYAGPDLDLITAAVREKLGEDYRMAGVGVHIGPTAAHPAGAYQVCTLLLVGNEAVLWDEPQRVLAVLRTVNEVRALKRMEPLALDADLARTADDLADRYLENRPAARKARELAPVLFGSLAGVPDTKTLVILYETSHLGQLASDLQARVAQDRHRKVGISVKPIGAGLTVNFVVILLFED